MTGVEALFALLAEKGRDIRDIGAAKIAAIGPATAGALKERGLVTNYMPEVYDGLHLARGLAEITYDTPVLMIRAKEGSPELTAELAARKINFTELPLYETIYEQTGIIPRGADTAIFTSASTVKGFVASVGEDADFSRMVGACIGAQTAAEARKHGIPAAVAREATMDALVELITALRD